MTALTEIGSSEEIALFNPAFLSRLLHATVANYGEAKGSAFPVPLAFLATPLTLHKAIRADLPKNAASQMQRWIREHPRHLVNVSSSVLGLRPFTGIAIRFGLAHGVLQSSDGLLGAGQLRRRTRSISAVETDEIEECLSSARFLGRWFARQPDAATLLAWWGLAP